MTTLEAIVSISQTVLRANGRWTTRFGWLVTGIMAVSGIAGLLALL